MATLVIQGKEVDVDDKFLSLAPEQQQAAVDEIAKSMQIGPSFAKAGKPSGIVDSIKAGLQGATSGLAGTLGAPVDLVNLAIGAKDPFLGSASIRSMLNTAQNAAAVATNRGDGTANYAPADASELAPELRPSFMAGTAAGGALPFVGALGLAARAAPVATQIARTALPAGNAATGALRQMVAGAAQNPNFAAQQVLPSVGASLGAYGAEVFAPGSQLAQLVGQLGGGTIGSLGAGTATSGGGSLASFAQKVAPTSDEAAKFVAGQKLARVMEQAGEDPAAIISRLQTPDVVPGALAGARAGSRAVTGVQNYLEGSRPDLTNAITASRDVVGQGIRTGLQESFAPGQASALTETASRLRSSFAKNLDNLVVTAETKAQQELDKALSSASETVSSARLKSTFAGGQAAEAMAPISPLTSQRAQAVNVKARDILEEALGKARKTESDLWKRAPLTAPAQPISSVAAFDDLKANMLQEDKLPGIIERVMGRFRSSLEPPAEGAEAPAPILFKDLQNLRSDLLDDIRGLRSQGNYKDARRLGAIADGLLDDMSRVPGDAVKNAREFSLALNDRFSRSVAGDILGTKGTGADRVRPELTLETAATGSPEKVAAQFRELQTAVADQAPAMRATQEEFLRTLSERVIDPTTGAINPRSADKFLRDNAAILDNFPEYRDALRAASSRQATAETAAASVPIAEKAAAGIVKQAEKDAERAVNDALSRTGDAAKKADKVSAFARVLAAGEDPANAVLSAINSNTPVRDMTKLAVLALKGGKDAVGGLRSSVLSAVSSQSKVGNNFSYGRMSEILSKPLSPGGPSILKSLENNKILSREQAAGINSMVARGVEEEIGNALGIQVKEFGSQSGILSRYAARFLGTKVGSLLPVSGAGQSLQVANMAANLGERLSSKLPADTVNAIMAKALIADSPDLLIDILEKSMLSMGKSAAQSVNPDILAFITSMRALLAQASGVEQEENKRPIVFR